MVEADQSGVQEKPEKKARIDVDAGFLLGAES
jgi:hypothetical protein